MTLVIYLVKTSGDSVGIEARKLVLHSKVISDLLETKVHPMQSIWGTAGLNAECVAPICTSGNEFQRQPHESARFFV